jgi:hypothetical protein
MVRAIRQTETLIAKTQPPAIMIQQAALLSARLAEEATPAQQFMTVRQLLAATSTSNACQAEYMVRAIHQTETLIASKIHPWQPPIFQLTPDIIVRTYKAPD